MQTNYNEEVLQQGGDVLMKKWQVQFVFWKSKHTHERQRDARENEETKNEKLEVQGITFNYFALPQSKDLNIFMFYIMMKAIKKYCCFKSTHF